MSTQAGRPDADLLFCHQCENQWRQNATGLRCPRCESEFVEVVSQLLAFWLALQETNPSNQVQNDDDPRLGQHGQDNAEAHPDSLPQHPLHHLNPWARSRPGSDDGNIEHVEWNPTPGLHFSRTSFRSTSPRGGFPGQPGNDPLASLFQSMFETPPIRGQHPGGPRPGNPFPTPFSAPPHQTPWESYQPQFPDPHRNQPGHGGRNTYTTTRVWPAPPSPTNTGNNHLQEYVI